MKNMFKMMGVALLAGAMLFTACKKDETTTNNNAANNTPVSPIAVTFDGTSWSCNEVIDCTEISTGAKFDIYKDANALMASVQFAADDAMGTYSFANSSYYAVYYDGTNMYNTPSADGSINITGFDVLNYTMSGTVTAAFAEKGLSVILTDAKWAYVI